MLLDRAALAGGDLERDLESGEAVREVFVAFALAEEWNRCRSSFLLLGFAFSVFLSLDISVCSVRSLSDISVTWENQMKCVFNKSDRDFKTNPASHLAVVEPGHGLHFTTYQLLLIENLRLHLSDFLGERVRG